MRRTKKVVTSAKLKSSDSPSVLNLDPRTRSVVIGRRQGDGETPAGFIGKVCESNTGTSFLDYSVWLDLSFPHVIGVFGTRGSGKSFDLGVLIECVAGQPSVTAGDLPSAAILIFDVQNQFWTLGLQPNPELAEDESHIGWLADWDLPPSALENVALWLPAGCESRLPNTRTLRLSPSQLNTEDWLSLLRLERYSAMGQCLLTLLEAAPGEGPAYLADRCRPSETLNSFQDATIDGVQWRLAGLAGTAIVGDPGIAVEDLLEPGLTSVLLLRDLPEGLRALAVGVVTRLVAERMGRHHQELRVARRHGMEVEGARLPTRAWLVLDEAHVVAPAQGSTAATRPIVDYVKRGRDAGLSMVFATQQPSAVDSKLMSQVDLTLTHVLGFESDLTAAVHRMPTRTALNYQLAASKLPSLTEVIRSLDPGEAIVADAKSGRAFVVRIRPRVTAHGGNTPI